MSETKPSVLVVDDKPNMLRLMTKVLRGVAQVHTAGDGAGALSVLDEEAIDVVLCDLRMPDLSGLDVLRACKLRQPTAEFILMTAYATVETAVAALKEGAYDYLTKPFEPEEAKAIVLRALHSGRPRRAVAEEDEILPAVHARSRAMRELATIVRQIAPTELNVFIVGESGSGKKRIARAIHALSSHRDQALVTLDCHALAPTALTAEVERLVGQPEVRAGTVLFEDVDALDASVQATLASALEGGTLDPARPRRGARIIATAQQDLDHLVSKGAFRGDLSLQLRVARLHVPPLRKRREDVPVLAAHLLMETGDTGPDHAEAGFTAGAMERLVTTQWPGNIRELRAVVEHAAALRGDDRIGLETLPEWLRTNETTEARWDTLTWADALARGRADAARHYLGALLKCFEGDVVKAAAQAGVERESFYRLLRRHGIQPESFRGDSGERADDTEARPEEPEGKGSSTT